MSALERSESDEESGTSANPACGCPTPRELPAKMVHPVLPKAATAMEEEEAGLFRRRAVR